IKLGDVLSFSDFCHHTICMHPFFYCEELEELLSVWYKLSEYCFKRPPLPCPIPLTNLFPVLGNSYYSFNVYEFSDKYLRSLIGELIFAYNLFYNKLAFQFLQDLMEAIRRKAQKENNNSVLNFVNSFYRHSYGGGQEKEGFGEFYDEGGGIGIIHTIINLGEGK
ncbi:MAG: hypothetical protein ACOC80_13725, partial [Petrotogales bacterium]